MSSRQAIRRTFAAAKLLLVWLAIVAYCATAIGIAIPLPAATPKVATEPFPCQHHRCGCQTADQCRRQCCCFSADQKLAWARAQGVPEQAVVDESSRLAAGPAGKSCCHKRDAQRGASRPVQESAPGLDFISAAKCQGLATLWITLGVALPTARTAPASTDVPPPSDTLRSPAIRFTSTSFPPPVPPPRTV